MVAARAVERPEMRAESCGAGPAQIMRRGLFAPPRRPRNAIRSAAMYVHHDGDGVVKANGTRKLSAAFESAGVEHTTLLLPGGAQS